MEQYQITTRPRHLRYVFFIDENYSYEKLFKLICSNQGIWGGRMNPIIPVKDNVISEDYISLLKHYDPDYIYYTENIDPETLKNLRIFNPYCYSVLNDIYLDNIVGVDAFYLLPKFEFNPKVLLSEMLWDTTDPLIDFYKLNYGLEAHSLIQRYELTKNNFQIKINEFNLNLGLNQIINRERPIFQNDLSRCNLNTNILRAKNDSQNKDFEIVLSENKSTIRDLLYYWNRNLYSGKSTIFATIDEIKKLIQDKYFNENLFEFNNRENIINITSMSISEEFIIKIIENELNPNLEIIKFKYKSIEKFPFEILDANGLYERDFGELITIQTLISNKGLFHLPKLSFTSKVEFGPQEWVVDVVIKNLNDRTFNEIKFPYTLSSTSIIKGVKGRVNNKRDLSIIIHNQQSPSDVVEFEIPDLKSLFSQLISLPFIHGFEEETKFFHVASHDDSNKLSGFIKLFESNLDTIQEFFTDKFWVDLFEKLIKNDKVVGDSISFNEITESVLKKLESNSIIITEKSESYFNKENLKKGLLLTLDELVKYQVFLRGFNLKCKKCSSEFWYHINEVNETITCRGCFEHFDLGIEPEFKYKLNDLVKNNIFQPKTSRDGNLTVIRTLAEIKRRSIKSFMYIPQLNLYNDYFHKPFTDIDIVCISDGKFIIGEAKHDSLLFKEKSYKSINSIAEIANEIHPDTIILSCYTDSRKALEKAKRHLEALFYNKKFAPKIETILLQEPVYNFDTYRYFYD